jgi:hypothetical protein
MPSLSALSSRIFHRPIRSGLVVCAIGVVTWAWFEPSTRDLTPNQAGACIQETLAEQEQRVRAVLEAYAQAQARRAAASLTVIE